MNRILATSLATTLCLASAALASTANPQSAAANWLSQCISCHGMEGRGDTPKGQSLRARDLTSTEIQQNRTDAQFIKSIRQGFVDASGKATMPYFDSEQLSTDEVKELIAYVRALRR